MKATKVNAGLAESNGRLLLGIWRDSLHVTCGLTACTPGSAPGPTLGNEHGKTLRFYLHGAKNIEGNTRHQWPSHNLSSTTTKFVTEEDAKTKTKEDTQCQKS